MDDKIYVLYVDMDKVDVEDIKASLRDKKDLCEKICNEKKNNIDEIITKCKKYYNNNVIKYFSGVDKIKGEFDNGCKKYKEEFSKYYNEEIYKLKEIFLEKINDIHDINNNSSFKKLGDIKIENDDAFTYGRLIGKKEGILVGISSGAALYAAIQVANPQTGPASQLFQDSAS